MGMEFKLFWIPHSASLSNIKLQTHKFLFGILRVISIKAYSQSYAIISDGYNINSEISKSSIISERVASFFNFISNISENKKLEFCL